MNYLYNIQKPTVIQLQFGRQHFIYSTLNCFEEAAATLLNKVVEHFVNN